LIVNEAGLKMISFIEEKREELMKLCQQFNVKHLELFGSAVKGKNFHKDKSDIDFLVEFFPMAPVEHARCYFDMLESLQDMFRCDIDLLEVKAIKNPYLLDSINKNRSRIYAA
jgi:predicted nucleotidyltransferase